MCGLGSGWSVLGASANGTSDGCEDVFSYPGYCAGVGYMGLVGAEHGEDWPEGSVYREDASREIRRALFVVHHR
jgi:hypothetical protein